MTSATLLKRDSGTHALSGLRQFLATENLLKMMKNAFYFTLKPLFIFWIFGHGKERLNKKAQADFKIYDVTNGISNSCNTHIARYLKK